MLPRQDMLAGRFENNNDNDNNNYRNNNDYNDNNIDDNLVY